MSRTFDRHSAGYAVIRFAFISAALLGVYGAHAQEVSEDNEDSEIDWEAFAEEEAVYETVVKGEHPAEEGLSRKRITKEELQRRGSKTVAEAVEHEPCVFASSGKKGERTFRLRGFDQRGVVVYLDGVPIAMPYSGSIDLGKFPAQMLNSILLLKGPTSVVHGPGGMGGALLLETRDATEAPLLELELEGGGDAEGRASLYHAYDAGEFAYSLGLGASGSDGYNLSSQFEPTEYENGGGLSNSDRRIRHGAFKLQVPLGERNLFTSQAFVVDGEFGVPRSTTDSRPFFSRFNVWRSAVGQVAHVFDNDAVRVEEAFYVAVFDNQLDSYDDATFTTQDGPNAYSSWYHDRTVGGRVNYEQKIDGIPHGSTYLRLWLAGQYDVHRTRMDEDEEHRKYARTLLSIVPEVEIPVMKHLTALVSVQGDLEFTNNEGMALEGFSGQLEDETTFAVGPFASLRWDPAKALMARFFVARRNRIPSLSERYSSRLGFTQPNPALSPENAWYTGLDVDWDAVDCLSFELSVFDAEVRDMISNEYLPETNGVTQKQNIGRARLAGAEGAVVYKPFPKLTLSAGYAFLYARRLDPSDDEDRIAQIPAHQAVFGAIAKPHKKVSVSSYLRIIGPQAFDDYNILGLGELGTYAVWDARTDVRVLDQVTVWVMGQNLLDMNYQTQYGYPDRGLSIWMGLRLSVD